MTLLKVMISLSLPVGAFYSSLPCLLLSSTSSRNVNKDAIFLLPSFTPVLPNFNAENQKQGLDSKLSEDVDKVNPAYVSSDEEVLTGDEVIQDSAKKEPVDAKKKKKYFIKPKFGRKAKARDVGGIENPMTIVQGSVDMSTGQDVMSGVDVTEDIPQNTNVIFSSEEDRGFQNPVFVVNVSMVDDDKLSSTGGSSEESDNSSSSDVTLESTSSFWPGSHRKRI